MPTITISLSGSSVVNGSRSKTISDADVQRLIDFMSIRYSPTRDPRGDTGTVPLAPGPALVAWADTVFNDIKRDVEQSLRDAAQRTAADAVTPVSLT